MNNKIYPSIPQDATKDFFEMNGTNYRITHLAQPGQENVTNFHGTWESDPPQVKTLCGLKVSPFSCVEINCTCKECRAIFSEEYMGAFEPEDPPVYEPGDPPGLSLSEQYPDEFEPHQDDPDLDRPEPNARCACCGGPTYVENFDIADAPFYICGKCSFG